ncbi:hypothetical protein GCK72_002783 [Caenorhabditis remanei]|uniref:EGF-like domain-containing protein n=1 Tax=Caenorhabditis remanei TaxID=31234 RepID=A0A6A5HT94_CAERE|nr:hypothetical protein GCK72_002783 [Caenorhabditis remanei]KAF1770959.1 hypothetical protein GCK72_002783 [Caenorhabditis remanei]
MVVVSVYLDACPAACSNHGTCVSDTSAFCICDVGFTGSSCDAPASAVSAAVVETSSIGFFARWFSSFFHIFFLISFVPVLPWLLFGLAVIWIGVSHVRRWYARRRRRSVAVQTTLSISPPADPSAPAAKDSTVVPFPSYLSISSTPLNKEKLRNEAVAEERESPVALFICLPDGEYFNRNRLKHLMADKSGLGWLIYISLPLNHLHHPKSSHSTVTFLLADLHHTAIQPNKDSTHGYTHYKTSFHS